MFKKLLDSMPKALAAFALALVFTAGSAVLSQTVPGSHGVVAYLTPHAALAADIPTVSPDTFSATDAVNVTYASANVGLSYLKTILPWFFIVTIGIALTWLGYGLVMSMIRKRKKKGGK
jgi:hypothetical protein